MITCDWDHFLCDPDYPGDTPAISEHVWGPEGGDRDMLRQLVHRLRGKIARLISPDVAEQVAPSPDKFSIRLPRIETIPSLGYGLNVNSDQ